MLAYHVAVMFDEGAMVPEMSRYESPMMSSSCGGSWSGHTQVGSSGSSAISITRGR